MFEKITFKRQKPYISNIVMPIVILLLILIWLYPYIPIDIIWGNSFDNVIAIDKNTWVGKVKYEWFKKDYPENTLILPSIKTNMPIYNWNDMNKMDNWYATMIFPERKLWEANNVVITWHRYLIYRFDKSNFLYYISDVEVWDLVYVYWDWYLYTYRVVRTEIVPPTQISVHNNSKDKILTIYSCHPLNSSANRFVVTSEFVGKSKV